MMGNGKKKSLLNIRKPAITPHQNKDYDVKEALGVLSEYVKRGHSTAEGTTGERLNPSSGNQQNLSSDNFHDEYTESGTRSYDKLEDKFYDFNRTNEAAHKNIISKIDEKISQSESRTNKVLDEVKTIANGNLSEKWFFIAVGVLGTLVSLVWALSYYPLINKVEDNSKQIESIDKEIINIKNSIDNLKNSDRSYQSSTANDSYKIKH